MRPLRLIVNGFGSYREQADLNLSDVDFFVLTGPTGSGKSTVIDALCFALYGTAPRWGRKDGVRNSLAPSASSGQVALIFEAGGQRYVVARSVTRNARTNKVGTKEARLERLDDSVPVDTELDQVLSARPESLAGGDKVTEAVTRLLGIGYEHFTQCVLLPQGRFADFLNATSAERQDLLIELLAYAVYADVGQRARERAKIAAGRSDLLTRQLAELGVVTPEVISAAERMVTELTRLVPAVDASVESLAVLRDRLTEADRQAAEHRNQVAELAGLRMSSDVPELAAQLAEADGRVAASQADVARLERAQAEAEEQIDGLADRSELDRLRAAHARNSMLDKELTNARQRLTAAESEEEGATGELGRAETEAEDAAARLAAAEQQHRAVALAAELRVGEPCPVCRQEVHDLPHRDVPADFAAARARDKSAKTTMTHARARLTTAARTTATARTTVDGLERQLAEVAAVLADTPGAAEVETALAARTAADAALEMARRDTKAARAALVKAKGDRERLVEVERRAWSALRAARDRFVALSAPAVDDPDLATAWQSLLNWAKDKQLALATETAELEATVRGLQDQAKALTEGLARLLSEHGVPVGDPARAPVALATHRERAERDLADLRDRMHRATGIQTEIADARKESEVATLLGNLLRSDGFERWLCAEALDSLVLEASETLMQLSGGQYELDRGERNEFLVIDHNDAGTSRPVRTLSGGETFQASLALALALSRQVMGLSGGRRSLDAMFLDEGFGTLDETALDTVASTLERLVEQSGSMIGIVTHVPALAQRVPVQFAVTRTGASSHVERVSV